MKQNAFNVPTVADIAAFFHSEVIDPQFDDAYFDLCDAAHAARGVLCDEILRAGRDDMIEAA